MIAFYLSAVRYTATLNSVAILYLLFLASGVVESLLAPAWLRLPLVVFSVGLGSAFLAMFWAQFLQQSLHLGIKSGFRLWFPSFCAMLFVFVSLGAFLLGVWGTVGLASFSWFNDNAWQSLPNGHPLPDFRPMHPR
ncbi:hypothetical protein [Alcaligenes endophyticus]|uniref:Uncharacterized protein n=1 Tax=Alcaligenes endophyticus TaxID=1929088 RepID=A0ABT8EL40_9BURK|nr:hypothetical protein [Alcaligenes endophyticus]MCX5590625.1 hypothetical protein [Alcaligenes endophyticus]MDN4122011.1 hypothetical protein [Alcaligenes endophyticus]